LGATTSREAARRLAAQEGTEHYNRHVDKPIGIVGHPRSLPMISPSIGQAGSTGDHADGVPIRENQTPYSAPPARQSRHFPWPFPTAGRESNDLTALQTVMIILGLIIGFGIAGVAAITIVDGLSRLHLR
jgi:hypothetical protein